MSISILKIIISHLFLSDDNIHPEYLLIFTLALKEVNHEVNLYWTTS